MNAPSIQVRRYDIRDPLLRPFVKYIWIMSSDGTVFIDKRMLPVANIDLVFSRRDSTTYVTEGEAPTTVNNCHILGIHDHPHKVKQEGYLSVLGVSFRPAGAFPFFGIPMLEFRNRATEVDLVDKEFADRLHHGLSSVKSGNDMLGCVETELKRMLNQRLVPEERVPWIAGRLSDSRESTTVEAVCDECGVHIRTAERWFHKYIGIGPKQFQRISRFQQASNDLLYNRPPDLTTLAYNRGFFDQSHFIREFAAFAGAAPSTFLAAGDSMRAALIPGAEKGAE